MDKECFEITEKRKKKIRNVFIFFISLQLFVILSGTDALFPFFIYPMFSYEVGALNHTVFTAVVVDENDNEIPYIDAFDVYPHTQRAIGRSLKFLVKSEEKKKSLAQRLLAEKPKYKKFRIYSVTTNKDIYKSLLLGETKISRKRFQELITTDRHVVYEYPQQD